MRNLGLLNYSPVSPILSHPVTQLLSTDFHLRAEFYTKLCPVWLSSLSGKMRGTCLHVRLAQKNLCPSPLLPLSTQGQLQTPGWSKPMAFPCWGGHEDGFPLLSICFSCYDCGLLCSLGRLSLVLLNPANGRPSCKTYLLAVRFGCR